MAALDRIDVAASALVLVDYQERLMPAIHAGERVLANALLLADAARELGIAVTGTEQNPAGLGPNVAAIRERCAGTVAKERFDACADGLLAKLGDHEPLARQVVVAGCEAHVCLMQTALGLLRFGYRVFVVADASGSRAAENHRLAMERLRQAGAVIVSTEMVVFEWLHTCRNEHFKAVLARLKQG
jgi:nicotinamidase-related amidase